MTLLLGMLWIAFVLGSVMLFAWWINELDARKRRREKMHPGE